MDIDLKIRDAQRAAQRLIERYGIEEPDHIRIEDIAWDLGADVTEGALNGAAARLVRFGNRAVIRVSTTVGHIGHRRFSIAHELGHLVLEHSGDSIALCTSENMQDFRARHGSQEAEANAFAAELLIPSSLASRRCDVSPVNFNVVRRLADDFSVSLTAAAIRFVHMAPERCAVVFSQAETIRWFAKSGTFWPFIEVGPRVASSSLAYDYFHGGTITDRCESVDADAWSTQAADRGVEVIREHSVALPVVNGVLSLLWIPERSIGS